MLDYFAALFDYTRTELIWIGIGLLGQCLFMMRFLWQWIVSEREKRSTVPVAFWYFSLGGGAVLFSYAVHRQDIVIMLGQATGLFIYSRNLYLIRREQKQRALMVPDTAAE